MKNIFSFQFLGILTFFLVISTILNIGDAYVGSGFINKFLDTQVLSIMATLMGLNIATASFLISNLINIELKTSKKIDFKSTRNEIKDNLYFMIALLSLEFIILIFKHQIPEADLKQKFPEIILNHQDIFLMNTLGIFFLALLIYALYEMTQAIFSMHKLMLSLD